MNGGKRMTTEVDKKMSTIFWTTYYLKNHTESYRKRQRNSGKKLDNINNEKSEP